MAAARVWWSKKRFLVWCTERRGLPVHMAAEAWRFFSENALHTDRRWSGENKCWQLRLIIDFDD